jgi:hypothetical protein
MITAHDISYLPIPMPSLAHSVPSPASDRRDTAGVSAPPPRRSALPSAGHRVHPVLGWRTILQLLTRRAAGSIAFSVPDRNALWSRAEDSLLMQAVAKYKVYQKYFRLMCRDWIEVASELPGRRWHN